MPALVAYLLLFVGLAVFFVFIHLVMGRFVRPVKPSADNVPPEKWSKNFDPRNGEVVDVVGPICESGDYLAQARPLPLTPLSGSAPQSRRTGEESGGRAVPRHGSVEGR